eukprot:CAMPEP_0119529480 /NCGR_PEP_ID=MMETSP1344-20130328/43480_1 /TAXON_ID=236787 /ORGANISM="Florenciella parvula, Strain CCMP2471" /LENGTH=37 /DNA_ID= /DNA_START= /DNA_END= /DNA_ORIENTATION=
MVGGGLPPASASSHRGTRSIVAASPGNNRRSPRSARI